MILLFVKPDYSRRPGPLFEVFCESEGRPVKAGTITTTRNVPWDDPVGDCAIPTPHVDNESMVISSSPHHDDVSVHISTVYRAVQGKADVAFEKDNESMDKITLVHLDDAIVYIRLDGCVSEENLGVWISLSG
jgi:hypothetical protein